MEETITFATIEGAAQEDGFLKWKSQTALLVACTDDLAVYTTLISEFSFLRNLI